MEKAIHVKGHWRDGKYVKPYNYIRTFKEPSFKNGRIGKSYMDDIRRKIIAIKRYDDFQSPEYHAIMDYLDKECPEVASIVGDSTKDKPIRISNKINKDTYDKINYAYDMLYPK